MPRFIHKMIKNDHSITEKEVKAGKIDIFDALSNDLHSRILEENRVHIDTVLISPVLSSLPRYSIGIYFYLLTLLKSNREPILMHSTQLKVNSTDITKRQTFEQYFELLSGSGLIFRFRSHEYYINPVYAWTGERQDYFNADYLPYKAE